MKHLTYLSSSWIHFCTAAVETALWDLLAKEKKFPLYKLLGGSKRKIECGLAVGIYDSIDELLAVIGKI